MFRLRSLRKEKNMIQLKIAKDLQISQASLSKYENDLTKPDTSMIIRLAKYFNVSTDYLLGYSDIKNPISKGDLTHDEIDYLLTYKGLSHLQKEKVKAYINGMLGENKNSI